MGVRILYDSRNELAALFCSTSDFAFGPLFSGDNDHDADERAEAFLRWLPSAPKWATYEKAADFDTRHDPRVLTDKGLESAFTDWRSQESAQWKREAGCEACGEPVGEGAALCAACMESR